jgi:hypothetical protein
MDVGYAKQQDGDRNDTPAVPDVVSMRETMTMSTPVSCRDGARDTWTRRYGRIA